MVNQAIEWQHSSFDEYNYMVLDRVKYRGITRHVIGGGGVHIHIIFVFCPTDFFCKQLFVRYLNMNMHPLPQLSCQVTALIKYDK